MTRVGGDARLGVDLEGGVAGDGVGDETRALLEHTGVGCARGERDLPARDLIDRLF